MTLRNLTLRLAAMACLTALPLGGIAADKPAVPPALPPGVTPAMMHAMMTPLSGHPAAVPAGTQPIGGCVPTMGYHYVLPKDNPRGPIYGFYKGKATFTELMLTNAEMLKADWNDALKPLPGYAIDHVDIWYEKRGHPGYEVPHFDVHAWYVPHAEHMKWCGNTSGKKPAWL
jgi:hypothetical protein